MFETASPPQLKGCRAVVLGGGNVALDCAAAARKAGASDVNVACIEPHDAMLSSQEEFDIAVSEGVKIHNSMTFVEIYGKNGRVTGMKLASVPENEEVSIDADMIIFAVGQRPGIDENFGLPLDENGYIVSEKSSSASVHGVFAAGDAVTGTVSVIQAIAAARAAAETIDIFLCGDGVIDEMLAPAQEKSPQLGKIDGFWELPRHDEDAVCEAGRCLQCDLRLDIAPQKFWTDYSDVGGAL
jgi:NADPH-dependent glutamate synthase beta subunit-like oxidoreductase